MNTHTDLNPLAQLTDDQLLTRAAAAYRAYEIAGGALRYWKQVERYEMECQQPGRPADLWLRVMRRVQQEKTERGRLNRANLDNFDSFFANDGNP